MSAGRKMSSHAQRRRRWLNLATPATRCLAAEVDRQLLPLLLAEGFDEPARVAADPKLQVSGADVELWRRHAPERFEFVRFQFDKYRAPRFQFRFGHIARESGRWSALRSGSVVPRGVRYLHAWGKPRWCPSRFWSERDSCRLVSQLVPMIGQVMRFFADGEREANLGELIDGSVLVRAMSDADGP